MSCRVLHLIHGSHHSQYPKKYKTNRNSETRWNMIQKIQDCRRLKQVKRQINLCFQKKILIDMLCESNINTTAEEIVSSENIVCYLQSCSKYFETL